MNLNFHFIFPNFHSLSSLFSLSLFSFYRQFCHFSAAGLSRVREVVGGAGQAGRGGASTDGTQQPVARGDGPAAGGVADAVARADRTDQRQLLRVLCPAGLCGRGATGGAGGEQGGLDQEPFPKKIFTKQEKW